MCTSLEEVIYNVESAYAYIISVSDKVESEIVEQEADKTIKFIRKQENDISNLNSKLKLIKALVALSDLEICKQINSILEEG